MIGAFKYQSPRSMAEALGSLSDQWGQVEILAGGSDLLALMKERLSTPQTVVNVKSLPELKGIEVKDGQIRIGAAVTLTELSEHAAVNKHLKALAIAARDVGSTQIRNVGTVGGNLCQRTRDWYFRNGIAEPGEELQYSAIFPMENQIYVHPSTLAPALIAYGATATIAGPKGQRSVPVEKLFQTSDLKTKREIAIAPNEIIVSVSAPASTAGACNIEVRERLSHDWPLVQAVAVVTASDGVVKQARVVLGHVAPVPLRCEPAEKAVIGKKLDDKLALEAGKAAAQGAKPTKKNEYKVQLVQVAVKRALLGAMGNEYWRAS